MIVLLTKSTWMFDHPNIRVMDDHRYSLDWLMGEKDRQELLGVDTETRGFDPHSGTLLMLQIGTADHQVVVDTQTIDPRLFKEVIEYDNTIYHNAQFDLRWMYKYGIYPRKVYDTYIAERVLDNSTTGRAKGYYALDSVAKRYLGKDLDKSVRGDIHKEGLTPSTVLYAAEDVEVLPQILTKQLAKLERQDMVPVIEHVESRFSGACAYTEYCGFRLDAERWRKKMEEDNAALVQCEDELKSIIVAEYPEYKNGQGDLFSGYSIDFKPGSSPQVIKLLETMGIDPTIKDKKTGKLKKTSDDKMLSKHKDKPIIEKLIQWRKLSKVVSSYGKNYLKAINPVTGRVHARFNQIQARTGRMSSGGGEEAINLQNVPRGARTRGCFVTAPGNKFVVSDYSQQEKIVTANFSKDPGLIDFFTNGDGDIHCFATRHMYPELKDTSSADIKKYHSDKRTNCKNVGFAVDYGGDITTIMDTHGYSREQAQSMWDAYWKAFPTLPDFYAGQASSTWKNGYILISPVTGRKFFISDIRQLHETYANLTPKFWEYYRAHKAANSYEYQNKLKDKISWFYKSKSKIQKNSQNYPIQGSAAEITKIAASNFYNWILDNDYFGIVLICNIVHDEIVVECPEEMAEMVAEKLKFYMEQAGEPYCPIIPIKADPQISDQWEH